MSFFKIACPSGAFMLRVRLFLLRLTERKYVASPPANGGHPRVSSPLPGSSTLMTSAPMSPRIIEQNGPASTRVRSSTRTPASGGFFPVSPGGGEGRGEGVRFLFAESFFLLAVATRPSPPHALDHALGDGRHLLAAGARPPPEEPGPIREPHVGEVKHMI